MDEKTVYDVLVYFYIYMTVFTIGVIIISLNGMDIGTTVSSVLATLSNIGPGIELVGPTGNYAAFSSLSKITFSIIMIIGRIEIYPILILLLPQFWKKN